MTDRSRRKAGSIFDIVQIAAVAWRIDQCKPMMSLFRPHLQTVTRHAMAIRRVCSIVHCIDIIFDSPLCSAAMAHLPRTLTPRDTRFAAQAHVLGHTPSLCARRHLGLFPRSIELRRRIAIFLSDDDEILVSDDGGQRDLHMSRLPLEYTSQSPIEIRKATLL